MASASRPNRDLSLATRSVTLAALWSGRIVAQRGRRRGRCPRDERHSGFECRSAALAEDASDMLSNSVDTTAMRRRLTTPRPG